MIDIGKSCDVCGEVQTEEGYTIVIIGGKKTKVPTYNFIWGHMCGDEHICKECDDKSWEETNEFWYLEKGRK